MNIGIITQARTTSTRLPAKVLLQTADGTSVLAHHLQRLQHASLPIVVATTTNATDDILAAAATQNNAYCVRGSEDNVLSRYYAAAKQYGFDVIIRVTSDCPLIDANLILQGLHTYLLNYHVHLYYSNTLERSYARGFDFEIMSFFLLEDAYNNATLPTDLEHVTPYIHQNRSREVEVMQHTTTPNYSHQRITLDTPEDWQLIKILIEKYAAHTLNYTQISQILQQNPELLAINAHIEQKLYGFVQEKK
jgi:spore coat polysaccharide biosynthesis protein SpsF